MSLPEPIRSLPPNSLQAIALVIIANLIVWLAALPILALHPRLAAPAALSYTLGLRHALDADHISAIDLTTRRLVFASRRPATVGTFFSLGHSTVVILTCVAVAVTSGALRERFDGFERVGNIVGTSVSAVFLVVLCVVNGYVLWTLYGKIQATLGECTVVEDDEYEREEEVFMGQNSLDGGGAMMSMFRKLFRAIDRPWKMYPLGFVFGLGFDTSSEIAILGIASVQAVQGTSIWLILIFPILFTCEFLHVCALLGTSPDNPDSWHVPPRHHRWRSHAGPLYIQGFFPRQTRHSLLLIYSDLDYRHCVPLHCRGSGPIPHPERGRAQGQVLGRSRDHRRLL